MLISFFVLLQYNNTTILYYILLACCLSQVCFQDMAAYYNTILYTTYVLLILSMFSGYGCVVLYAVCERLSP